MIQHPPGISGMAAYLPSQRVDLEAWCGWRDDSWEKIRQVIGSGFRIRNVDENAYTMAATAVWRLINAYDIDPRRVGMLALGTESSTDNSAGAVIVRGMVDAALQAEGRAPLNRACEVPETKHACLGGIYAMKAAARYLQADGRDALAIVVCADVAEYAPHSSGEPTQGAGAVAMLMEAEPKLLAMDLSRSGNSSAYRTADFRKPFSRFVQQPPCALGQPRDFPVVNGKYSTTCYLDAVLSAGQALLPKLGGDPAAWYRSLAGVYLHRPYRRMAETGHAALYLLMLAAADDDELAEHAAAADVSVDALRAELTGAPDVAQLVRDGALGDELYPLTAKASRALRTAPAFRALSAGYGDAAMSEVGNLYTASLPAWLAAGLEQAEADGAAWTDRELLAVGYGSGDAAEIFALRAVDGWQRAARQIHFAAALAGANDINLARYEALHSGQCAHRRTATPGAFYVDRIGDGSNGFDDNGIEYYALRGSQPA